MKRAFQNLCLVLLSVAIGLLITEAALRWTGRFPAGDLHTVSAKEFERIPGMWEPGQDFVRRVIPDLPYHVHINSLGFRGPEVPLAPTRPRVLCIGDSFTFGPYVEDGETFPAQLAAQLGGSVEVLNGGVESTTIVDQKVFLDRMLALAPRIVILLYCENDLSDLLRNPPIHARLARNREMKSGPLGFVIRGIRDSSIFYALLRGHEAMLDMRAHLPVNRSRELTAGQGDPAEMRTLAERYARIAAEIRGELAQRGIGFLLVTFPDYRTLAGEQPGTIPFVTPLLQKEGVEVMDVTPALKATELPVSQLYLLPSDLHPSRRGYATAAAAVGPQVGGLLVVPGRP